MRINWRFIYGGVLCPHNTSEAMEAAGAYGFALRAAFLGESFEEIIDAAMRGGERLLEFVEEIRSSPSSSARIKEVVTKAGRWMNASLWTGSMRFWAMVYPRLMSAAVFGAFAMAGGDVFKAICMGGFHGRRHGYYCGSGWCFKYRLCWKPQHPRGYPGNYKTCESSGFGWSCRPGMGKDVKERGQEAGKEPEK